MSQFEYSFTCSIEYSANSDCDDILNFFVSKAIVRSSNSPFMPALLGASPSSTSITLFYSIAPPSLEDILCLIEKMKPSSTSDVQNFFFFFLNVLDSIVPSLVSIIICSLL